MISNIDLVTQITKSFRDHHEMIRKHELIKAYAEYANSNIEGLCTYLGNIHILDDRWATPSAIKVYILTDENSPLSEEDKVYLAAYNVS